MVLYSEGFTTAKSLGNKIVSLYRLSSQLLSPQQHYDWGLRAMKVTGFALIIATLVLTDSFFFFYIFGQAVLVTGGRLIQQFKKSKTKMTPEVSYSNDAGTDVH